MPEFSEKSRSRYGRFSRSIAIAGLLGLGGLLLSCNLTDRELGDAPIGPPVQSGLLDTTTWARDSVSGNLRIYATPQRVAAGNKAKATVTAKAFDGNGNPVRGRIVRFAASLGTITALDTTDADGIATATYTAVPRNGEVRIMAAATVVDTLSRVGTSIQLEGLTVALSPASTDTLVDREVPVAVTVTDGEGEPVAAAAVTLSGARDASGVTDGAGRFRTAVVRKEQGQTRLRAFSSGAGDSVTVAFWSTLPDARSRTILLFSEPSRIPAANGSTAKVKAVVYDDKHNPVEGKTVSFSASHGIISAQATTNAQGMAEATFQGLAQNVDATLTATVSMEDSVRRATATLSLAGLQVELRPAATEVKIGDTVGLSIRVRDADGNPVPNTRVALSGASQSSVTTNSSGVAAATVTSSGERAVPLKASALGGTDSTRVVFLTELPGGPQASKQGVGNMRVFVDNSALRASNTDQTTVRVIAFDRFNNPLSGRLVRFTANHGIITGSDTTDARGEAEAVYRSVPINTDARITATMVVDDSALAVATTVTLSGLEVDIRPQTANALLNRTVPVDIRLVDGAGNPVPDATIQFNGNPGVGTTNGDGVFATSVTSGSQKRVLITASALGARDTSHVDFWTVLPDPGDGNVTTIRRMRIFSSRSQLRADNSDFAAITVILTNEHNNPAAGETVKFTSNLGIIGETATVDADGRATVTLKATPVNGVAKVEATAVGRNLSASTEVLFSGVTLQLAPDRTELKLNQQAAIEAFLKDASGNPIGGDEAVFTLSGASAAFDNGSSTYAVTLNPNGRALVRVSAAAAGTVKVRASALNTTDSLLLRFSNNTLSLAASKTSLAVGGNDSALVTATYVDGGNNPVSGATITFAANAGTITSRTATTNSEGKASTWLRSADFSGTATVQANAPAGVAQLEVGFAAGAPAKIKLEVTADNIAVNGGLANLRATVTDAQGNTVSGPNVNFRILKGPGGGEEITKPVVQALAGAAVSHLRAGSVASGYRGVLVEAAVGDLADTSKLTISGPAHIITVSRPEDDSVPVAGGGSRDESTFEFNIGAVVQDINGNYVADGTEVHFSAVVTGMAVGRLVFDKWDGLGGSLESVKPLYRLVMRDIPFEDINNNLRFEQGIDINLDFDPSTLRRGDDRNGDGVFDWNPGVHDTWFDLNGNGVCDVDVGEDDTTVVGSGVNATLVYADLNKNGIRDRSEILVDRAPFNACNGPASGDYPFGTWEVREFLPYLEFRDNEFAVAIEVSATTVNGVAYAKLRYPRQFANRLYVNVNAETNGIRDKDGERFILPQLK
jgi:adhesin/invasin